MNKTEWAKKKREKCKEQGICVDCCCRPSQNGKCKCDICAERNRKNTALLKEKRKDQGKCLKCGCDIQTNTKWCDLCKKEQREIGKLLRNNRKENNLCVKCGKSKPCNCSATMKEIRENFRKEGKCIYCGTINDNNNSACDICILKGIATNNLKNRKLWLKIKELLEKQQFICPYSGIKLILGINASIDHIVPKSKGGNNEIENLQWVHLWINLMKKDSEEQDFVKQLECFTKSCINQQNLS